MRLCPFENCSEAILDDRFACPRHWRILTRDQQSAVWAAYRLYKTGKIELESLRKVQKRVLAEVEQAAAKRPCRTMDEVRGDASGQSRRSKN